MATRNVVLTDAQSEFITRLVSSGATRMSVKPCEPACGFSNGTRSN